MEGALCLALLLAPAAVGVEPTASVLIGYDSNAKRVPYSVPNDLDQGELLEPGAASPAVVGDAFLLASGSLAGSARFFGLSAGFDGALGTKLFFDLHEPTLKGGAGYESEREATRTDEERMVVGEGKAFVQGSMPWGMQGRVSTQAKARAQASGRRTYGFERSELRISRGIFGGLFGRGSLAGQVFHAADAPLYSHFGGGPGGGVSWRMSARESVDVELGTLLLAFPFTQLDPVRAPDVRRLDVPVHLALFFTSARRVFVSGGYVLVRNLSNASFEAFTRHRLFGIVGFRLPLDVTVSTRGALQLTQYDQGVSVAQQFFLQEDDESQNNFSLLVTRPFLGGLHIEGQLAWFGNELARGGVKFSRTTAAVGIRAEL